MPPKVNRTTQHTIAADDELWNDCMAIAKARRETMSAVARAAFVAYRLQHQALLDEIKRAADSAADSA